jgi:hypothetical protein
MADAQVADVRDLTRKAGITRLCPGYPLLTELAPGKRTYVAPVMKPAPRPLNAGAGRRVGGGAVEQTPEVPGTGPPRRLVLRVVW